MPRFPVYTDADIHGPIVRGLIGRGWNVVRAVDAKPEGTADIDHFRLAVDMGRVMIANDKHMKAIAERWVQGGALLPRARLVAAHGIRRHEHHRHPGGHRRGRSKTRCLRVPHRVHQAPPVAVSAG